MSAGWVALVCAIYLKKRRERHVPLHLRDAWNRLFWFDGGFNAGSAFKSAGSNGPGQLPLCFSIGSICLGYFRRYSRKKTQRHGNPPLVL
jgi:hypothetical protein